MLSKLARFAPALNTVLALAVLLVAAAALSWRADQGNAASEKLVGSMSWLLWRGTASASVLLFLVALVRGITELRHKWARADAVRPLQMAGYVLLSVLFVAVGIGAVSRASGTFFRLLPNLPLANLRVRTGAVLFIGALAVVPWLATVWLVHAASRDVRLQIAATASTAQADPDGESPFLPALRRLLDLWDAIVRSVLAFMVIIVATIVTTGALRGVFVEAFPTPPGQTDRFASVYVLLYGATFAFLLLVVTVPMVASWRVIAAQLIEATMPVPPELRFPEGWSDQRAILERMLHLDTPLMRSPLTALSALVPLATGALAAFVPELAA